LPGTESHDPLSSGMLWGMSLWEPKKEMDLWLSVLASLHDILN